MTLDRALCIRALNARDPRFDGVFFVGVTSTGIYCRPVCPAKPPRRDRCRFYANAAAAERKGFRPCLRWRPELAPGFAQMDSVQRVARVAVARIAEGALNGRSVDDLAREFEITGRQLRRVVEQEVGVSPIALAQTHRLLLAKRLLTDTALPMTHVAHASGFQSVRRFDALCQSRYRLTPSALRGDAAGAGIAQITALGVTTKRAESIQALARAVASGTLALNGGADAAKVVPQLLALPGIGEWTAEYVAMRALRWPDGFPASDLWLRRAAGSVSAARLARYAERWRPWRAYAAMHLWRGIGAGRVISVFEAQKK